MPSTWSGESADLLAPQRPDGADDTAAPDDGASAAVAGRPRTTLSDRVVASWRAVPARRRARLLFWYRHPSLVLLPVVAVVVVAEGALTDGVQFMRAGSTMFGPHVLDVFADDWLQIGPLYLLVVGAYYRLVHPMLADDPAAILLGGLEAVGVVAGGAWLAGRLAVERGRDPLLARWGVGAFLSLGGVAQLAAQWGHPEEIVLGLLLLAAGVLVQHGRPRAGGTTLALGFALKQWAVIGAAVALLRRRPRSIATVALWGAALGLGAYAPFLLFGTFHTFGLTWHFLPGTLGGSLWDRTGLSEWWFRVIQGGVAILAGVVAAWRRPSSPELVVLAAVGARLLLDPFQLAYYLCPFIAVFAVWLWTSPRAGRVRWSLLACGALGALVQFGFLAGHATFWAVVDSVVVAVVVWVAVAEAQPTPLA